jgi:hypothetical protein
VGVDLVAVADFDGGCKVLSRKCVVGRIQLRPDLVHSPEKADQDQDVGEIDAEVALNDFVEEREQVHQRVELEPESTWLRLQGDASPSRSPAEFRLPLGFFSSSAYQGQNAVSLPKIPYLSLICRASFAAADSQFPFLGEQGERREGIAS